jgi:hypothetical protein
MPDRSEIVARVIDLAQFNLDPEEAQRRWFYDIRRKGGMRLTKVGFDALTKSGLQSWQVPVDKTVLTKKNILEMNRRIGWPYYITTKPFALVLFSDRDAVLANLYGDIEKWLASIV